jgi:hypothetical protein
MWILGLLLVMFVASQVIGVIAVVYSGYLLRKFLFRRMSLAVSLAISNAIIIIVSMALYPTSIFVSDIPDDDIYLPYYFVPGFLICVLGAGIGDDLGPWLVTKMSNYQAAAMAVAIIPGIVCILLGSLQWCLIGLLSQWLSPNKLKPMPK